MADDVTFQSTTPATPPAGTVVAADVIGGSAYQRVKISQGADGSATDVSSAAPLQVSLANTGANTNKILVTPDLPSGASTSTKQSDGSQKTQIVDGSGNVIGATSNALDINIKSGNISGFATSAKQDTGNTSVGNIDTTLGAKTDAKSTATDTTSVSAISIWKQISASVQAIASSIAGTLTATVSGSVTANAGTNLNTSALALESGGNLATLAGAVSSSKVATKSASGDFADGSIVVLGAKADAKSTATDTTAITIMSVLKQISASIQAAAASLAGTLTVASHNVTNAGTFAVQATEADGAHVTFGAKADAKSTATDTTAITAMSVWKQISASVQAIASSVAGTLTVATHAVTQSGTWSVGATNLPTTVDTNSGNKSASTLRVVLATDQPALTNKLLVTPDANSAVNIAQINGVTTTMGNGASGTGVQRVTLANDSTGQVALTPSGTASLTSLASSASSAQLLASTAGRRGLALTNTDENDVYVKYGTTASATSFTVKIPPNGYWEAPQPVYTGRIDAIWAADGSGSLYATELT